jgi:hypothetical protein
MVGLNVSRVDDPQGLQPTALCGEGQQFDTADTRGTIQVNYALKVALPKQALHPRRPTRGGRHVRAQVSQSSNPLSLPLVRQVDQDFPGAEKHAEEQNQEQQGSQPEL